MLFCPTRYWHKTSRSLYDTRMGTKRNRGGDIQAEVVVRLREARKAANLTQEEVGSALGLSRAGYGHLEDGSRSMTLDDLVKLAGLVGRSPAHLLGLEGDLTADEDRLLAVYRAIGSERERRLVLDMALLAAKPVST
jgi:transcriptional regulator with XRE-family HTH domain